MAPASRSYGRIAHRYEQARGGADRAVQIQAALRPWLRDAQLLCDVGMGTGVIAAQLHAGRTHVVGFDISVEMLRQAHRRLSGRVAVADAALLPLRSMSVDAVLFVWVLHHVGDLQAALREAARVARRGGSVIAVSGYPAAVDDDIDPIFRGLDEALRPERLTHGDEVSAAAAGAGMRVEFTGDAVVTFDTTPSQIAGAVQDRMYAPLWDLDQKRWQSVVEPAIRALRSLAEPDRARHRVVRHPMWVWRPC